MPLYALHTHSIHMFQCSTFYKLVNSFHHKGQKLLY